MTHGLGSTAIPSPWPAHGLDHGAIFHFPCAMCVQLMTDRGEYQSFLEIQLERVSAACLQAQGFDERIDKVTATIPPPPTSTAYPLFSTPVMGFFRGRETDTVVDKLDNEFKELVEAELAALEELTVSGSSSVTDTNWGLSCETNAGRRMYTQQYKPADMMFNYAQSQKET